MAEAAFGDASTRPLPSNEPFGQLGIEPHQERVADLSDKLGPRADVLPPASGRSSTTR